MTVDDLLAKARALQGKTVAEIAAALSVDTRGDAVRTKGTPGAILERALGATGGSGRVVDFPEIGVELKTIPVDEKGSPSESTYVCTLSLADAETQEWETSWVRAKLARVLFVPLIAPAARISGAAAPRRSDVAWTERRVGAPVLWSPTRDQDDVLRGDFDDVVGLIGIGRIEDLTAHRGRWLQVRPKARDGSVRTVAWGADNEAIETVPRGFYLRTRFTGAILVDPAALPE